jgi:hypothetical protein
VASAYVDRLAVSDELEGVSGIYFDQNERPEPRHRLMTKRLANGCGN